MTCGIYRLYQPGDESKVYIGSSKNIEKRWREHRRALERGEHHNRNLQSAFNVSGPFECEIIELCSPEKLLKREYHHSIEWDAFEYGYNITRQRLGLRTIDNRSMEVKELNLPAYSSLRLNTACAITNLPEHYIVEVALNRYFDAIGIPNNTDLREIRKTITPPLPGKLLTMWYTLKYRTREKYWRLYGKITGKTYRFVKVKKVKLKGY